MQQSRSSRSRRRFLASAGVLAASAALPKVLFARTGGAARLVVVVLRGALDGLAAVPPHGDGDYRDLHRELAIPAPGAPDGALPLDGTFGLHPSLGFFARALPEWRTDRLPSGGLALPRTVALRRPECSRKRF